MIDPQEIANSPAMRSVIQERMRQEAKWGEQDHSYPLYKVILGEELGEADRAYLEGTFYAGDKESRDKHLANLRVELVQVAAVALAMVECCDRNNWHVPPKGKTE